MRFPLAVSSLCTLGALTGAGCGPAFTVTDSFTPVSEGLFASPPDSLHDYVVGTEVILVVHASRAFIDLNAVDVVSKTPELLEVIEQGHVKDELRVRIRALAEGTASLALLDAEQRPIEERVIEVKLPDAIELAVNIDTERGFTIPQLDPDGLLIADGGKASFRVTYTRDGGELKGVNVLRSSGGPIGVDNPVLSGPDREFLELRAAEVSDPIAVPLLVAGETITTLQVRPTSLDEIATIQLDEGTLPSWRNNGDASLVWAKAFTEDAVPIFGVPFAWTFDSAAVDGTGDLITYNYAGGERRRIQVGAGEAVEDLTVEAQNGSAVVSSTANVGCSAAASTPAPPIAALVAAGALSLVRPRRRRA
jgi:uncharacterized protein (TIGR03382 family)